MDCPHCKKIKIKVNYGLKLYYHEEGGLCNILNSMETAGGEILSKMYGVSDVINEMSYLFVDSIRKDVHLFLSKINDKSELAEEVKKIVKIFTKSDGLIECNMAFKDFIDDFGQTGMNNLAYFNYRNLPTAYRNMRARLSMLEIKELYKQNFHKNSFYEQNKGLKEMLSKLGKNS
jgi:hypothetical protein